MTPADLRQTVIDALARIAPEIRSAEVQPGVTLRDQFDIDSMDFLNFVIALHDRLGVTIPESDYARLTTLDSIVEYLNAQIRARPEAR